MRRPIFGLRVRALRGRVERQHQRIAELERELKRVSPQVAALEERLEDLRQRVELPDLDATSLERAEARSLVDEVRREHARVRARISAATVFEERLRVLEAAAYQAVQPPSTTTAEPVTNEDAGEAR